MSAAAPPTAAPFNYSGGQIQVQLGKTRKFRIQVQDRLTLQPVDITGWSAFKFLAKTNISDTDLQAIITKTLGGGISVVNPASAGQIEILLSASDTSALTETPVHLFAEAQGVDPLGQPWTLWQGEVAIVTTVVQASS